MQIASTSKFNLLFLGLPFTVGYDSTKLATDQVLADDLVANKEAASTPRRTQLHLVGIPIPLNYASFLRP